MKKIICCLMALLLVASFAGCAKPEPAETSSLPNQEEAPASKKLSIVATTFPQYDWIREILGDKLDSFELTLLIDDGVDLHSYQPTVEDIAKVSTCDMFVYVGGESDAWVHDALETAQNKDMVVINMLEVLGDKAKEEEIIEGMEHDHEHEHDEIHPEDIQDRPLSDWKGSWVSIEKALNSGALDEYMEHQAEENEKTMEEQKADYAKRWKSDYANITITDAGIDFGGTAADYQYIGYKLVESDHGSSVWYGFEASDAKEGVAKFVAFNDHGIGGETEESHDPHYHLRYGNESFDALVAIEEWAPTFFLSEASDEEVAEAMGGHSHEHEHELDEHVWLSLKNAELICNQLSAEIQKMDETNATLYQNNTQGYVAQLQELDKKYADSLSSSPVKTLLFGGRFPFRYLVDDYGLDYYAAFSGCSAETEASFETILFLSGKLDELELSKVMVIESSDQKIANTVIQNASKKDQSILVLDSMQSVTAKDVADGASYLSIMEKNLEVLKDALS